MAVETYLHLRHQLDSADSHREATSRPASGTNLIMRKIKLRSWIEILLLIAVTACGVALLLASRSEAAGPVAVRSQQTASAHVSNASIEAFEGVVTDTRCGAKHSAKVNLSVGDCTRFCVHNGERFALVDGDKTYVLNGAPQLLKRLAGERVRIAGTLNNNTIEVASVVEFNPKTE
jgi:hypothetical protein